LSLAHEATRSREALLQTLSEVALSLCRAHSAGFNIAESDDGANWCALAGRWTLRNPPPVEESLQRPVYVDGKVFGTLSVISHEPTRRFDGEDLRLLTSLATFATATLQSANSPATSRRHARFLLQLTDALRTLGDPLDIQAEASRRLGEFLGVNRVSYATIEGTHGVIRRGYVHDVEPMVGRLPLRAFGEGLLEECLRGNPIVVANVATDRRLTAHERERYRAVEIAAFCGVTLMKHGRWVAAFVVHSVTPREWTPEEIELTRDVAERTWAALERAVAEAALRKSEEKYRALFASIDEGFALLEVMFDNTGKPVDLIVLEANEAWQRHSAAAQDWLEIFGRVARTGRSVRREVFCSSLDRWFSTYAARVGDDDSRQIAVVVNDITAHKNAEDSLRRSRESLSNLVDRAPFGVYIVDASYRIVLINGDAQDRAFRNVRPALGRDLREALRVIWPEPVAADVLSQFQRTLETGEPYYSKDYIEARADIGGIEAYEWELHRISLPDGQPGVVCYFYDSTQLRRAEESLRHHADLLRDADRRKNEFLAMLAHELRNPLAPIRTAAQILRRTSAGNATIEAASNMLERQVGQMARLVDDLVDISRITRGKIELRKERIELTAAVSLALESIRAHCESMNQDLTITRPIHPISVNADPARLAQVVGNLLSNACKYTERGGRIQLMVAREGADAVIRVRDTGIGIAPEQLPRIFDLFAQVDTSLERTQSGLGIGLTLVKTLVELHDGSVDVSSEGLGRGSEFVVRLPALVDQPAQPSHQLPSGDQESTMRLRVLVVDDNRDAAHSMAMLLELNGHHVHTAFDGESAVTDAAALQPDAILLDIGLPGLNGYEAAKRIRAAQGSRRMALVALTGWGQDEDRRRSEEAGFDAHLVKPVDHVELSKLLTELCQR
jgi:signal transduction histidine kinase